MFLQRADRAPLVSGKSEVRFEYVVELTVRFETVEVREQKKLVRFQCQPYHLTQTAVRDPAAC
mgnify:FL=1